MDITYLSSTKPTLRSWKQAQFMKDASKSCPPEKVTSSPWPDDAMTDRMLEFPRLRDIIQ